MNRIIDLYAGALINARRTFEVRRSSWGLPERAYGCSEGPRAGPARVQNLRE